MKKMILLAVLGILSNTLHSQIGQTKKKELDSLRNELEVLFMKDQTFRRIYIEAEKKLGKNSNEMEYFWEVVESQDKVLEIQVIKIIEKYGWLGISQVGKLANTAIWAVLQHGSVESKEKYSPLLKESVLKKESQPMHYARLVDRMLINADNPQIYGTQYKYNSKGKGTFFTVEQPEYINQRRRKLGLKTIQKFAKQVGIEWNVPQKK
ncbi:DUF6624 domain-containing protein [Aquimarina sp. AU119]|uniref:DUF6624 domain-containing protein n=1 Tax=Aquimarina sp. AU119 TaxID=2108528 RepID=UPI000D69F8A5|nr:DUF6624 domain-containing protein [Aquimarina sp. AU119]